ncbi:DUF4166 domain-containing protein [Acidovorax sp. NCPPB 4044]|uniref:DUF4166 domain-containing protein n=1 Tax=Acidovorax sp. NCPPB 4044 TaxID=2940490 RepID=UPI0023039FF5|nr:DUF4166 domain-containing protein [Acidovorax sp. NCPPB 4044]MDA8522704.1 DUF4166 domain-containing protein [Acidovorax sp. NCPPB 4044]
MSTPSTHPSTGAAAQPHTLDLAAVLGSAGWSRLAPAVRRRFAAGHPAAVYEGSMALRCSRVGRGFAWLARCLKSPLAPLCRAGVPVQVRVQGDGRGGVVWERHLQVPGAPVHVVRSTKSLGADGRVQERTDGGLSMVLEVREEAGALVFLSRRYFLAVGPLRLPIPAVLTPGTCRVEHRDLGAGRFAFTLEMRHPLWGCTFHQTGVFADPEEFLP